MCSDKVGLSFVGETEQHNNNNYLYYLRQKVGEIDPSSLLESIEEHDRLLFFNLLTFCLGFEPFFSFYVTLHAIYIFIHSTFSEHTFSRILTEGVFRPAFLNPNYSTTRIFDKKKIYTTRN